MDVGTPTISFRSPSKLNRQSLDQLTLRSGTTIESGLFQGAVDVAALNESVGEQSGKGENDASEEMEISRDGDNEEAEEDDDDDPDWVTDEEAEVGDGDESEDGDEDAEGDDSKDVVEDDADDAEKDAEIGDDNNESGWLTDEEEEVIGGGTPLSAKKSTSSLGDSSAVISRPSNSLANTSQITTAVSAPSPDSGEGSLKRKLDFVDTDVSEEDSSSKKQATTSEPDDTDIMLSAFVDAPPDSD